MIRAYVAPTEQPAIWVEVEASRVVTVALRGPLGNPVRTVILELSLDESADLREQMHRAEVTADLPCEMPTCKGHQVAGGYCAEHGGVS